MSVELDFGTFTYQGVSYQLYAYVNDEFPTEIDFIRVTFGHCELFEIRPSKANCKMQKYAVAIAQGRLEEVRWDLVLES